MRFDLYPRIGVGPLNFGLSRSEIESVLGIKPHSFLRNQFSQSMTDHFEMLRLFVYYDKFDCAEAFEFPADADLELKNVQLCGLSAQAFARAVELDSAFEVSEDSVGSERLCVSAYYPGLSKDQSAPQQSVIVYKPGYFN
ncbi:MAG: hypothetical protein AAFP81_12635 [Pseudomonadota bacterium]